MCPAASPAQQTTLRDWSGRRKVLELVSYHYKSFLLTFYRTRRNLRSRPFGPYTSMNIRPLADAWQDLRYACRTLSRSRSFVVMATLMLALGIGANTAIFSVVLTVLIRPLPYADAERVVWLSNQNTTLGVSGAFLNPADILDFREQSRSFERIVAWGTLPLNLYGARSLERVEGVYVTPNFFRTLGV